MSGEAEEPETRPLISTLGAFALQDPWDGQIGWEFEVGAYDLTAMGLRVYLPTAHAATLTLWEPDETGAAGTLLAETSVTSVVDDWASGAIPSTVLSASARYVIAVRVIDHSYYSTDTGTPPPGFALDGVTWIDGRFRGATDGFPEFTADRFYGIVDLLVLDEPNVSGTAAGASTLAGAADLGWSPADLSPQAWYDADDVDSFTFSSGDVVSQWDDKSGNGRHLTASGDAQPSRSGLVNSRAAVMFNGTSNWMQSSAFTAPTRPFTILAVARSEDSGQRTLIMATGTSRDGRVFQTSGGTIDMYQGEFLSTGANWGADVHAVAAVFNGASSKISYDGNAQVVGDAGVVDFGTTWLMGAFTGGGSEFWPGPVCEIVCVEGEISAANRASWEAYAADKWGVLL